MAKPFSFHGQIILDLANNHQGEVDHAKRILDLLVEEIAETDFSVGVKFQFRDLPNFIHEHAQASSSNKHVKRFLETQLAWGDYEELLSYVRLCGFSSICTPFDEASVDKVKELGFDAIKIASCSASDWPLLEKIAGAAMPVVASTGGLNAHGVDDLVSFLGHRGCTFALMHCVSIYPTNDYECNIMNIAGFRRRYPSVPVGWSTHENPDDTLIGPLAMAAGASMFERHVGLATERHALNTYSSNPAQIGRWVRALEKSKAILGQEARGEPGTEEVTAIRELQRGIYARRELYPGDVIPKADVYFAFPRRDEQLSAGEWKEDLVASNDTRAGSPLLRNSISAGEPSPVVTLKDAVHEVKALLAGAGVTLQPQFETEFSHHYGMTRFREWGATIITVINRSYAKKILVMLPGQRHPNHYHKLKEETFLIIQGELEIVLDGQERTLRPGETLLVPPGVFHSFGSREGCVFEEISTTSTKGDSVYQDEDINALRYEERKTTVDNWGRFQLELRSSG